MTNKSKTILVTGCSSGIGAHCVGRLRQDGWQVFATARKSEDIKRLQDEGFHTFFLDYRDAGSIEACFTAVMAQTGGTLDAVFNNGAYAQPGAVEDIPTEALREQLEANVIGVHHLTRLVLPIMRSQGYGRIVQHSSVLGLIPFGLRGAYNASKFALEGLYSTMYMELSGTDIHVSLIETGPIATKIGYNGLAYVEKYIDVETSHYRAQYEPRLAQMRAGGMPGGTGVEAEPVYRQLVRALNHKKPRPHYYVTPFTHVSGLMRRFLPSRLVYRLLGGWS